MVSIFKYSAISCIRLRLFEPERLVECTFTGASGFFTGGLVAAVIGTFFRPEKGGVGAVEMDQLGKRCFLLADAILIWKVEALRDERT
jgi:hypothetical protein